MLKVLYRKWWVILLQGILLIILSVYAFNNPKALLVALSFWMGVFVLGAGIVGVFSYFTAEGEEKENFSLGWSIISVIIGFMMLAHIVVAMKTVTLLFGIWMVATGVSLTKWGMEATKQGAMGWIVLLVGVMSVVLGVMMFFDKSLAAVGISTLLGIHAMLAGIGFIALGLLKRNAADKFKELKAELKERLQ
jgi:uncharacterized membrane protein HdeD (DUF308 family)